MARSVEEVLALAEEFESRECSQLIHYVGPRGGMHVRHSARWEELLHILDEDKIFRCADCGCMVSYHELESWCCDFDDLEEGLVCSCCYEEEMGDDL